MFQCNATGQFHNRVVITQSFKFMKENKSSRLCRHESLHGMVTLCFNVFSKRLKLVVSNFEETTLINFSYGMCKSAEMKPGSFEW